MAENHISSVERSVMYQLLASSYLQKPSLENVRLIFELTENAKDIFTEIDFSNLYEESKKRYELIKEDPNTIEQIKQEYFDHMIVPISASYIPPYESVIKGATKVQNILGKKNKRGWDYNKGLETVLYNTELAYETVGFNPDKLNRAKELRDSTKVDHIGFELAFMAYLNEQESQGESNINWYKLQSQFLKEHLLDFSEKYNEISWEKSNGFYKSLSDVLKNFIRWDNDTRKIQEVK